VAEPRYFVGVDLGQVADYTAMAVLERATIIPLRQPIYALRHLERVPRSTSYPDVVRAVADLMTRLPTHSILIADATGVGRAVIDLMREAKLRPVPVVVHGGQQSTTDEYGYRRIPKREMVAVAQVTMQQQRLKFARSLPLVRTLQEELQNFKIKITEAGNDTYGEWREGQHDDLVFALALACWYAEREAALSDWIAVHPTGTITRSTVPQPRPTTDAERALVGARARIAKLVPGRSR
jgi:hypothetical protein